MALNSDESKALSSLESGVSDWPPLYRRYLDLAQRGAFQAAHQIMVDQIYPLIANIESAADVLNTEQQKTLVAARELSLIHI